MHPHFGEGDPGAARERSHTFEGSQLGSLYENLADFQEVAAREEDCLAALAREVPDAAIVRVPFLSTDVHDLDGMAEVGRHLF
jgi:hypothetical protein